MPRPKKPIDPNAPPKVRKPRTPKLDPETGEPIKPVRKKDPRKKVNVRLLEKGDKIRAYTKENGIEVFTFVRVDGFFSISIADILSPDGTERVLRLPCMAPLHYVDGFYEPIFVLSEYRKQIFHD